jgi:SNF2 family DNA or RNA helicase
VLKHTDLPQGQIHVFDSKPAPEGRRVYVVGIESLSASNRVALDYNRLCTPDSFVAVDESSYIKGHRAKRTQRIIYMSARARYRAILTGTPFTQGAVDLYSQMTFLSPKILGYSSFYSFAANHLVYEERRMPDGRRLRTGRIIRTHNEDYLAAKIAPYIYQVRKDECLDLPDKLHETRYCGMTEAQRAIYEEAKERFLLDAEPDDWGPINLFKLFTALQTIVCGWWESPTGLRAVAHGRLALLMDTNTKMH